MARKTVGLALSSGGARGFAHVGVIKVLEENNIPIDYIAGTSMGSIVAAYYALFGSVEGLDEFAHNFKRRDLFKLLDFNNLKKSLIKGERAKRWLEDNFGDRYFKDTLIPLRVSATSLEDGSKVIFEKGPIVLAVLASCSLPGFLPPIEYKGKHLVDGGIIDTTPVSLLDKWNPDVIIAVDLYKLNKIEFHSESIIDILQRTQDIMMSRLSDYSEEQYADHIVVIKPSAGRNTEILAFHKVEEKVKAGERAARKALPDIKKMLR